MRLEMRRLDLLLLAVQEGVLGLASGVEHRQEQMYNEFNLTKLIDRPRYVGS